MVSADELITACDDAVARLREEKLALVEAVLQLKLEERTYWQAALDRERFLDVLTQPPRQLTADEARERERKIHAYQERIAATEISEEELRVLLEESRRHAKRSTSRSADAAEDLAHSLQRLHLGESSAHTGYLQPKA